MHRVGLRPGTVLVRLAVDAARLYAAAGDEKAVTFGPMIATAGADVVGCLRTDLGRAAEFADGNHQCFLQQTAGRHIFDECRQRLIEDRTAVISQHGEIVAVRVPRTVGARFRFVVATRRPGNLYEARLGLDQPAGQQQTLAEPRHAVTPAKLGRFVFQAKRVYRRFRLNQRLCLFVKSVERRFRPQCVTSFAKDAPQIEPRLQTVERHIARQREAGRLERFGRIAVLRVGIVGRPQQAGRLTDADFAAFLDRCANGDVAESAPARMAGTWPR